LSHSQVLLFGRLYHVHSFASTTQIDTTRQVLDSRLHFCDRKSKRTTCMSNLQDSYMCSF